MEEEDMAIGPEQPGSLGKLLREDSEARWGGILYGALGMSIRMAGDKQRDKGSSEVADRLEVIADGYALRGILLQSGVDISGLTSRKEDPEIIDGEIIETRRELE